MGRIELIIARLRSDWFFPRRNQRHLSALVCATAAGGALDSKLMEEVVGRDGGGEGNKCAHPSID